MKPFCLIACLFVCGLSKSQKTETYYDFSWKKCDPLLARFYSIVEKTDSGWLRKDYYIGGMKMQMQALFADSACNVYNGTTYFFYANGQLSEMGRRLNNKQEGVCLSFHYNGAMSDSATYHDGKQVGSRLKWHANGFPSDSIYYKNDSIKIAVGWFDDGSPSEAGYLKNDQSDGKWNFYHKNGKIAASEIYSQGKLVSAEYHNEDGIAESSTPKEEQPATFKGGLDGWRRHLEKNLYWPDGYHFKDGNMAVVGVTFTVNEEGKIEDSYVSTPFHPEFDKIALRTILQSPKWKSATQDNRRVKYRMTQAITFTEPE
ncbi:MAG: energy transducer TonB [Chitinophagaceae bacterium]